MTYSFLLRSDLGVAWFDEEAGTPGEDMMPGLYKAPEVILRMKWNYKGDIWSMAMVVRKNYSYPFYSRSVRCSSHRNFLRRSGTVLLEPLCFKGQSHDGTFSGRIHIAEMVAIKDPPPANLEREQQE